MPKWRNGRRARLRTVSNLGESSNLSFGTHSFHSRQTCDRGSLARPNPPAGGVGGSPLSGTEKGIDIITT